MKNFEPTGKSMLLINKYMKLFVKERMRKYNLNYGEVMALLNFYEKNGISPDYIVEELQHDKALITRITSSLEEKGLLTREKNQADNRSVLFFLTKKGQELKPEIINILQEWRDVLFSGIEKQDLTTLFTCMQIMVDNVSKIKY